LRIPTSDLRRPGWTRRVVRLPSDRPNQARLFDVCRPIPANIEAQLSCGKPSLAPKRVRPAYRDFLPAARLRDRHETANNFRILTRRRQSSTPVSEGSNTIWEIVFAPDLDEAAAYMVRHDGQIFLGEGVSRSTCRRDTGGGHFLLGALARS
jgi:hypothetical protein